MIATNGWPTAVIVSTDEWEAIEDTVFRIGDRQVVAVMAYPTFVDTRVAAAHNGCRIIGATANTTGAKSTATGRAPLVWTPKLPVTFSGERFVTSSAGSITIEIRVTPLSQWHRYVATSRSMRWTSGG